MPDNKYLYPGLGSQPALQLPTPVPPPTEASAEGPGLQDPRFDPPALAAAAAGGLIPMIGRAGITAAISQLPAVMAEQGALQTVPTALGELPRGGQLNLDPEQFDLSEPYAMAAPQQLQLPFTTPAAATQPFTQMGLGTGELTMPETIQPETPSGWFRYSQKPKYTLQGKTTPIQSIMTGFGIQGSKASKTIPFGPDEEKYLYDRYPEYRSKISGVVPPAPGEPLPDPTKLIYHGLATDLQHDPEDAVATSLRRLRAIQQQGLKKGWFAETPHRPFGPIFIGTDPKNIPFDVELHSYHLDPTFELAAHRPYHVSPDELWVLDHELNLLGRAGPSAVAYAQAGGPITSMPNSLNKIKGTMEQKAQHVLANSGSYNSYEVNWAKNFLGEPAPGVQTAMPASLNNVAGLSSDSHEAAQQIMDEQGAYAPHEVAWAKSILGQGLPPDEPDISWGENKIPESLETLAGQNPSLWAKTIINEHKAMPNSGAFSPEELQWAHKYMGVPMPQASQMPPVPKSLGTLQGSPMDNAKFIMSTSNPELYSQEELDWAQKMVAQVQAPAAVEPPIPGTLKATMGSSADYPEPWAKAIIEYVNKGKQGLYSPGEIKWAQEYLGQPQAPQMPEALKLHKEFNAPNATDLEFAQYVLNDVKTGKATVGGFFSKEEVNWAQNVVNAAGSLQMPDTIKELKPSSMSEQAFAQQISSAVAAGKGNLYTPEEIDWAHAAAQPQSKPIYDSAGFLTNGAELLQAHAGVSANTAKSIIQAADDQNMSLLEYLKTYFDKSEPELIKILEAGE